MPKRKLSTNINKSSKKIPLEDITGINANLEIIETSEKASKTDKFYADETSEYFFFIRPNS